MDRPGFRSPACSFSREPRRPSSVSRFLAGCTDRNRQRIPAGFSGKSIALQSMSPRQGLRPSRPGEGFPQALSAFHPFPRLRKPAGAVAADLAFASKFFTIASGIYTADYAFLDIDGDENEVLRRIFFAPAIRISFDANTGTEFDLGGIVHADTLRNASITESVPMILSGGIEARIQKRSFYGNIRVKRTDDGADFSCLANFRKFIADWLPMATERSNFRTAGQSRNARTGGYGNYVEDNDPYRTNLQRRCRDFCGVSRYRRQTSSFRRRHRNSIVQMVEFLVEAVFRRGKNR